jgi:hypothetical protein
MVLVICVVVITSSIQEGDVQTRNNQCGENSIPVEFVRFITETINLVETGTTEVGL